MKQYKNPNELVEYLMLKGVSVSNKEDKLNKRLEFDRLINIELKNRLIIHKQLTFVNN